MLRKYITDPIHVIDYEPLQLNEDLSYEEKQIRILAREVKALCNRNIAFVKVLWRNHHTEEATWEREVEISEKFSELDTSRNYNQAFFIFMDNQSIFKYSWETLPESCLFIRNIDGLVARDLHLSFCL